MAETTNAAKAHKPGFIKGLKAEFKKIVWLGAVIAFLDYLIKNGLNIILLLGQG